MKKIRNRILALMLSCYMVFGVVSTDYIEVQAFEWALPAIGIEEALKWLLALLGVSIAGKAVGDNVNWTDLKEDCIQHQYEMGNSQVAVSKWWNDILSGSLDQASSCWTAFKDWVNDLLSNNSSVVEASNFLDVSKALITLSGKEFSSNFTLENSTSDCYCAFFNLYRVSGTHNRPAYFFTTDKTYNLVATTSGYKIVASDNSNFTYFYVRSITSSNDVISFMTLSDAITTNEVLLDFSTNLETSIYTSFGLNNLSNLLVNNISSVNADDSDIDIDSYKEDVSDIALTDANATTTSIPDTIPLPWDNVSDTADGVTEVLEGLMEKVQEGIMTLEDYMEAVQEMLSVSVIDTSSDEVWPITIVNDEPIKWPDVVADNVSNSDFTLVGLEKVFPFCIPWDIKDFVTLLVAEPVAPTIHYPIQNGFTHETLYIDIDFEDWEPIVVLFRYIFDFLLIIGLLLLARSLIGAGGSE